MVQSTSGIGPLPSGIPQDGIDRFHQAVLLEGLDDKILDAGLYRLDYHGLLAHGGAHHHIGLVVLGADEPLGDLTGNTLDYILKRFDKTEGKLLSTTVFCYDKCANTLYPCSFNN